MLPLAAFNWDATDFIIFGLMLFSLGLAIRYFINWNGTSKRKAVFIMVAALVMLLIWAELGVGIFGTPFAGS